MSWSNSAIAHPVWKQLWHTIDNRSGCRREAIWKSGIFRQKALTRFTVRNGRAISNIIMAHSGDPALLQKGKNEVARHQKVLRKQF